MSSEVPEWNQELVEAGASVQETVGVLYEVNVVVGTAEILITADGMSSVPDVVAMTILSAGGQYKSTGSVSMSAEHLVALRNRDETQVMGKLEEPSMRSITTTAEDGENAMGNLQVSLTCREAFMDFTLNDTFFVSQFVHQGSAIFGWLPQDPSCTKAAHHHFGPNLLQTEVELTVLCQHVRGSIRNDLGMDFGITLDFGIQIDINNTTERPSFAFSLTDFQAGVKTHNKVDTPMSVGPVNAKLSWSHPRENVSSWAAEFYCQGLEGADIEFRMTIDEILSALLLVRRLWARMQLPDLFQERSAQFPALGVPLFKASEVAVGGQEAFPEPDGNRASIVLKLGACSLVYYDEQGRLLPAFKVRFANTFIRGVLAEQFGSVIVASTVRIDYFNTNLVCWEPLVEPVSIEVQQAVNMNTTLKSTTKVRIKGTPGQPNPLNINYSRALYSTFLALKLPIQGMDKGSVSANTLRLYNQLGMPILYGSTKDHLHELHVNGITNVDPADDFVPKNRIDFNRAATLGIYILIPELQAIGGRVRARARASASCEG